MDNMIQAGFSNISVRDRNEWFAEYAEQEYVEAIGVKRGQMVVMFGEDKSDSIAAAAKRRALIGSQGHLRPTHFFTRKD